MWILLLTLLGSSINIPLVDFLTEKAISGTVVYHHDAVCRAGEASWAGDGLGNQHERSAHPDHAAALFGAQETAYDGSCALRGSGGAHMTSTREPSLSTASTICPYLLVVAAKPPGLNPVSRRTQACRKHTTSAGEPTCSEKARGRVTVILAPPSSRLDADTVPP